METLGITFQKHLNIYARGNAILERLFSWKLDDIRKRVANRLGWNEKFSQQVEHEYRRFIFLAASGDGTNYGMAGPVDEFWHEHIVDTRDYFAMCLTVAERYIHHCPSCDKDESDIDYARTLRELEVIFGPINNEVWPLAHELKCMGKACKGACKSSIS